MILRGYLIDPFLYFRVISMKSDSAFSASESQIVPIKIYGTILVMDRSFLVEITVDM